MDHQATIADVAREAGVSRQTVSRALNNKLEISAETRARVLAVVDHLGYRPSTIARGLVTRRTLAIGLVVPDIANPFFSEVARGAEDAAQEAGYSLLLGNTVEDPGREERLLFTLEAQRVDGIILCSSRLPAEHLLALAARYPVMVLINRSIPSAGIPSFSIDDEAGAIAGVSHLLGNGRRVVGFLAGPASSYSGQQRMAGYRHALAAAGLPVTSSLVRYCAPYIDGGCEAAAGLLAEQPGLDALFCYNDLVAAGALQACAAAGRLVPRDVAVVGADDILLSALITPSLTTLRSDTRQLGAAAVKCVLRRRGAPDGPCAQVLLRPELVIRQSA